MLGAGTGMQWMGLSMRDVKSAVGLWRLVCGAWGVTSGWRRRGWLVAGACG